MFEGLGQAISGSDSGDSGVSEEFEHPFSDVVKVADFKY